jgi:hypothetical protein
MLSLKKSINTRSLGMTGACLDDRPCDTVLKIPSGDLPALLPTH